MYRKISDFLVKWKNSKYRKPLVLQGARQVGKTYSILEFGQKNYENVAYFNFQTNPDLNKTFQEDISPQYLIPILSNIAGQTIVKEKTLIVFDEVQLCERALTSLKYFCESANEYHIIAAGSLLGVAVNRKHYSFPVGKTDRVTMFPMDIEEFMIAVGQKMLTDKIKVCYQKNEQMPAALHEIAIKLYRQYLVIGGMPEAVNRFVETKDYTFVRHIQKTILMDYIDDMSKYNTDNEIKKTRLTYDNITVQLSKKNTRFQYKLIKHGGRAKEFENSIEWLSVSNIISKIYKVEQIKKPLENYKDIDSFKIYMSDVGLLCAKKDVLIDDVLFENKELDDFKGGLVENFVNSQLIINGLKSYYWQSQREAEVDFVVQIDNDIIPIEVKSADNTKAKSLTVYINTFKPKYAIKISSKNFAFENNKKIIPLYSVFCIKDSLCPSGQGATAVCFVYF